MEGSDGGVGLLLEGLRMLENHFWTAEAGDESEGVGVVVVVVVLRLSKECCECVLLLLILRGFFHCSVPVSTTK